MTNNIQNNFTFQTVSPTDYLGLFVPESILRQGLMSPSSEALFCFAQHQFSYKLQAYMMNYVASVSSYYPLYA